MALQIAPTKDTSYNFTIEQYERMTQTGILQEDERVELIDGEIVKMSARGLRHEASVARLELIFHEQLLRKVVVWTQNSVRISPNSQLEPDVALLKWRDDLYESSRPTPEDVLLLVEVADSSLAEDRGRKRLRYAKAGIPEYWIVNLQDNVIEVYSEPVGEAYSMSRTAKRGQMLALPGGFENVIAVDEIIP